MPPSSPAPLRPRGPLPARVYWVRRCVVLGLALALVVGVSSLLSRLGDGSDGSGTARDPAAAPAAGSPSTTGPDSGADDTTDTTDPDGAVPPTGTDGASPGQGEGRGKGKDTGTPTTPATPEPPPLPEPEGSCLPSDIAVAPVSGQVAGGAPIGLTLNLRSISTAACTFSVSPDTFTATITSGSDNIWSSRECPQAVPTADLVLYQQQDTPVVLSWSGRRSDEDCSKSTEWALPGFYHVEAAALGGEPGDVQFEVVPAPVATVTKTVEPKTKKNR